MWNFGGKAIRICFSAPCVECSIPSQIQYTYVLMYGQIYGSEMCAELDGWPKLMDNIIIKFYRPILGHSSRSH